VADWDSREGKQQISDEIKLSVFSIIIMAGMTVGPGWRILLATSWDAFEFKRHK
jgi:hypothetical protein